MQRKKTSLFSKVINLLAVLVFICTIGSIYNIVVNKPLYISPELKPFFKQFKKDADRYNVDPIYGNLTMVFSHNLPIHIAGRCNPISNSIEINANTWQFRSTEIKKALLYHELAHCTLLRDHSEETFNVIFACPVSLMYPSIDIMHVCYQPFEDYYIRELFTNPHNYKLIGE